MVVTNGTRELDMSSLVSR